MKNQPQNNPKLQLDIKLGRDWHIKGVGHGRAWQGQSLLTWLPGVRIALHCQEPVHCSTPLLETHQSILSALGPETALPGCAKAKDIRERSVTCAQLVAQDLAGYPRLAFPLNPSFVFHLNINPLSSTRHNISPPVPGEGSFLATASLRATAGLRSLLNPRAVSVHFRHCATSQVAFRVAEGRLGP